MTTEKKKKSDVVKIDLDMTKGEVTWQHGGPTMKVKLLSSDVDLTLDLGPEVIAHLKQALSWSGR